MTVKELIKALSEFDGDWEVTGLWDGIPDWELHGVHEFHGRVVIDVAESSVDGWEALLKHEWRETPHEHIGTLDDPHFCALCGELLNAISLKRVP